MRTTARNVLWMLLAIWCLLPGCQTGQELSQNALLHTGQAPERRSSVVAEELGSVVVLKRNAQLFPKPNTEARTLIQQAGYELRGAVDEQTFRHLNGTTASVLYFTELKEDGISAGTMKIRNSGDSKALVRIDGAIVGECTILEPVVGLSDITYARPVALADGEQVPVGNVKVGPRHFNVVSKCQHIGTQGAVSVFFNGRNRTIWNDYEIDGRVVAKRTCPPDEAVEFSPKLNVVEQMCIAADMYFRLSEDRVVERASNTVFVPVYY